MEEEFIYESMVQRIFVEFCDLTIMYVGPLYDDEDLKWKKIRAVQDLGKSKAHAQKKRAKTGLKELPEAQRTVFVLGCYEELRIQLLRQLSRLLGETDDYKEAESFLTAVINEERDSFKKEILEVQS